MKRNMLPISTNFTNTTTHGDDISREIRSTAKSSSDGDAAHCGDESPDDESRESWLQEAKAVIDDIKFAVADIHVSQTLPISISGVYLNVMTKDGNKLCVEMSSRGFCVVANDYDQMQFHPGSEHEMIYYETPYALLNTYSPLFTSSFANALCDKLKTIQSDG